MGLEVGERSQPEPGETAGAAPDASVKATAFAAFATWEAGSFIQSCGVRREQKRSIHGKILKGARFWRPAMAYTNPGRAGVYPVYAVNAKMHRMNDGMKKNKQTKTATPAVPGSGTMDPKRSNSGQATGGLAVS